MNFLINCITSALVTLIICAGLALSGQYFLLNRKKEIKHKQFIKKICNFIIKSFLAWHIPLLLLQTIFSIIDMFTFLNGISRLLTTIVITVISVIIERFIEHGQFTEYFKGPFAYEANNTAVFAYIGLYSEIEKINRELIQQISISQSGLLSQFEMTNKETNFIMENINNYVQIQNSECQQLLEIKNDIYIFFNELSLNIRDFCSVFKQYENELEYSCNALKYYEKGESLLEDINESFKSKFEQSSNKFTGRIDDIERKLLRIVDGYSEFNNLIQSHTERIKFYHPRMENVLQSLQKGIDTKQSILVDKSREIADSVKEANNDLNDTLKKLNSYLNNNIFVLSKIFNTYKVSPLTPRELKKVIKNWPYIMKMK